MRNAVDLVVQSAMPVLVVPPSGLPTPIEQHQLRYLIARDGVWLEAQLPWVHLRCPISSAQSMQLPCGQVNRALHFTFQKFPLTLLERFKKEAKESDGPTAAWLIWHPVRGFRYANRSACSTEGIAPQFDSPALDDEECLVFDLQGNPHASPDLAHLVTANDSGSFVRVLGTYTRSSGINLCLYVNGTVIDLVDFPRPIKND